MFHFGPCPIAGRRARGILAWTALLATLGLAQAPPNDLCSGAIPLTLGVNGPFSNVGATDQPIVAPCVFAGDGHRDVWFRFDAASTFALQVDCCGLTSLDSILTAFDACGGTLIGCSNDSSCGAQSNMQITVAAGDSYFIRFCDFPPAGSGGAFSLNLAVAALAPPNDDCAGAIPVTLGVNGPFSNAGATDGPVTASCGFFGAVGNKDVWFQFTATNSAMLQVDQCGLFSGLDGMLSAYGACGGPELACGDSGCTFQVPLIQFPVAAGTTYYIRFASSPVYAPGGAFFLRLTELPPPPLNDDCSGAIPLSPGLNGFYNNSAATTGTVTASCTPGYKDIWFSYFSPGTCPVTIEDCNLTGGFPMMPLPRVLAVYTACGGTELACAHHNCGNGNDFAKVSFGAVAGQTYYIRYANVSEPYFGGNGALLVTPRLGLDMVSSGPGNVTIANGCGTPAAVYVTAIGINFAGNFPNGWFFGVDIPLPLLILELQIGVPPFVGVLDASGGSSFSVTNPALSGYTLYGVSLQFDSNGVATGNSVPFSFVIP